MDFMTLAATVCRELTSMLTQASSQIITVKNGNKRDVVTALDLRLHAAVEDFVHQADPSTIMLSEEDSHLAPVHYWSAGSLLVLDPLDGSNNHALGLPGYGLMAAHLTDRRISSSLVVLPERDLYLVWDGTQLITSQPVAFARSAPSATTYYAYPPTMDQEMAVARTQILGIVDEHSSGLYRTGSACIGLFQLLSGAHQAFVGHHLRVWDVLSYLPLLAHLGLPTRYRIDGLSATLITGHDQALVDEVGGIISRAPDATLHSYDRTCPLVIGGS